MAKALTKYTDEIRLVGPKFGKVNPTDELMSADLLNLKEVQKGVQDSSVAYLAVGLKYNIEVWKKE